MFGKKFYNILLYCVLIAFLIMAAGCLKDSKPHPASSSTMILNDSPPDVFEDDLQTESLLEAVDHSLSYLEKIPQNVVFRYGKLEYTARETAASLKLFKRLLKKKLSPQHFSDELKEKFLIFQSPDNQHDKALFTGYYEPVFQGSRVPDWKFRIPVYTMPKDLRVLRLGTFRPKLKNSTIVYRLENEKILPYYNRQEIMQDKVLAGQNLEIAWMKDSVDLFFLQIQGSGILSMPSGEQLRLDYNGSNGRPYRSIGKLLIKEKKMELSEVSMQSIRRYLRKHPELRDKILYHNQNYTFLKVNNNRLNPIGSIKVPLTPHRSIATDSNIFPKGALAYISAQAPFFDEEGRFQGYRKFSRLALNQDTGGAIKGTGRVDLFWGNGKLAEKSAGIMRSFGRLYFLIAKKEILSRLLNEANH